MLDLTRSEALDVAAKLIAYADEREATAERLEKSDVLIPATTARVRAGRARELAAKIEHQVFDREAAA